MLRIVLLTILVYAVGAYLSFVCERITSSVDFGDTRKRGRQQTRAAAA
jgi:hypothetical protein